MQPALAPAPHMLRQSAQDASNASAEAALRDQLLQHVNPKIEPSSKKPQGAYQDPKAVGQPGSSHNIDPAIAGPPTAIMSHSPADSAGDDGHNDSKKTGKRELSTSKRAAQNRAAQRAFRQRKEGHIKKLEEQVRDYNALTESYKLIQAENYQLRDYIINLQSKLIESQSDYPPAPVNLDLAPRTGPDGLPVHHGLPISTAAGASSHTHPATAPTAPMAGAQLSQLQASAAQAVAENERPDVNMQDRTDPQLTGTTSSS